jgi:hypothetical protein
MAVGPDTLVWKAPRRLLVALPAVVLLGWVALAVWALTRPERPSWTLVVTAGSSVVLAACVLVVAVQSSAGNDRGLPSGQLDALARLAGTSDSARGTDALTTVYGWREDQWRQLARGAAGVVVALLVAVVPLLLKAPTSEQVYGFPPAGGSAPDTGLSHDGLPLLQSTVSGGLGSFPPALWVALVDLLLLAVLAAMFARGAHRSFVRDVAALAARGS